MLALKELYKKAFGAEAVSVEKLPGAGSNRQYYRMTATDGQTYIGCIGTSTEENHAFITLTRHFTEKQLSVPHLYAVSDDESCYIQEDLGDQSLFQIIKKREYGWQDLVKETLRQLVRFQFEGAKGLDFSVCYPQPEFDKENVMFDLNYFKYCYLKATGIDFHEVRLQRDFEHLAERLVNIPHPTTFMYRDFQARNIMVKGGKPYFIDYQGGRKGPFYYDVASFLWQASAGYSDEERREFADFYFTNLSTQTSNLSTLSSDLNLFVLFRLLQVLGAYGFRGYFERKKHFLDSIPPALENLRKTIAEGIADDYHELKRICQQLVKKLDISSPIIAEASQRAPRANKPKPLVVRVFSFSYKKGIPEDESGNGGGYVFDCRSTHNPGRYEEYKQQTGMDQSVIDFLEKDGEILTFLDSVYRLADHHVQRWMERGFNNLMFSFGCTGGQHRSVYSAQHLAEYLNNKYGVEVHLCHRERGVTQVFQPKSI